MASEIDICNSALVRLGAATINAFSDNTVEAELCDQIYERVRDAVLGSHGWKFAIKRAQLPALSSTPEWGYQYEHQLPADYIRIWDIEYGQVTEYSVEGRKILSDTSPLRIRYIFQETLTGNYSSTFTEVLWRRLALEMSYSLVQSSTVQEALKSEYLLALADARSFDSQEATPEDAVNDVFLRSRVQTNDGDFANW